MGKGPLPNWPGQAWRPADRRIGGRAARSLVASTLLTVGLVGGCTPRCLTCDAGEEIVTAAPMAPIVAEPRQVRSAQRHLSALGHRPGPADGVVGPQTAAAVAAFQAKAGLEPDGRLTAEIVDRLREAHEAAQVRTVQRQLIGLGYDPGPVDGVEGQRTRQAIRQFQSDAGLGEDGRITSALAERLRDASRSLAIAPAASDEPVYSEPPFAPGERVLVSVNNGEDSLRELEIAKDGLITLPWGGQVKAAGLHAADVEVAIMTELFEDYLAKIKEQEAGLDRSEAAQRARQYLMGLEVDVRRAKEAAIKEDVKADDTTMATY